MTEPRTAAGRALDALIMIIAQLRKNNYSDWPDWLERDVLPVVREAEAAQLDVERLAAALRDGDGFVEHESIDWDSPAVGFHIDSPDDFDLAAEVIAAAYAKVKEGTG